MINKMRMHQRRENIVLMLTGTVCPNTADVLTITDPETRRQQYIDAIAFYLHNTPYKLVFSENSGTSLAGFFPESERLEFLVFQSQPVVPDRGKGYKELEIIDYCLQNSKLLDPHSIIVKITGRLKILNLNKLLKPFDRSVLLKDHLIMSNIYQRSKMDSRCFLFTRTFWPYLQQQKEFINTNYSFERALWQAVLNFKRENRGNYLQFSKPLRIEGVSGGFGIDYKHGNIKALAKRVEHCLRPFVFPEIFK